MIRSMTGFGRASVRVGSLGFEIEVQSVNHRYLDARVRVPRFLSAVEADIKARIQDRLGRGRIDMTIAMTEEGPRPAKLTVNLETAREYARAAVELARIDGVSGSLSVDTMIGLSGVASLVEPEIPLDDLREALVAGADEALDALEAMRATEGAAIERDVLSRLGRVAALAEALDLRADVVAQTVRDRLRKRSEQLSHETGLLDEARLHQEIVIAADRLDITEEIVRLRSHVEQFRVIAASSEGGPIGRRLDFLLQEFGREANTIGSKGSDAPIAHEVVELKTELERIREQVQNIE